MVYFCSSRSPDSDCAPTHRAGTKQIDILEQITKEVKDALFDPSGGRPSWRLIVVVEVKEIARRWFKLQEDHLNLKKKDYRRMEKELSASIAARFIQVEQQIGLLVDLGMLEETPLVNPVKK